MHASQLLLRFWPRQLAAAALTAIGVLLFMHGFLLTRVELDMYSSCDDVMPPPEAFSSGQNLGNGSAAWCDGEQRFDHVVWIIIDALRYDFVIEDFSYTGGSGRTGHVGKMSVVQDVLQAAVCGVQRNAWGADKQFLLYRATAGWHC